ncbi:MAG: ATP-dependent zinc metalloprotease FtsH, partial [Candidatus Phytoplasma australasiaticum]|nr:ATP-dependent zinc metalloprotease FtsH [Candidatus Phytoplasma australasiaticum]
DVTRYLFEIIQKNIINARNSSPQKEKNNFEIRGSKNSLLKEFSPLITVIYYLFNIFIFYFIYKTIKQVGNEYFMKNNKMNAKKIQVIQKKITFKDIAGAEEEKEEMKELIDFLQNPKKYSDMGARIPKGMLLFGPPGVGKTLLAMAVAGEANVPFFVSSGSEFVEMYVGLGASRVRQLFQEALKNSPCIIFIDEIEAVARKRGTFSGNSEQEHTLNQLLVELDGFNQNSGVIVMAATNKPEFLDSALTRPGRFDRHFYIGLPNVIDRESILKLHAKNKKFSPDIDLSELAKQTSGFSGAQLESVLNESALLATRKGSPFITKKDISESLDRILIGIAKKSKKYNEQEKKMVAYHEAGHAVIGIKIKNSQKIQKVTIIPRGNAGGYNLMMPEEETFFSSKKKLLSQIISLLGGRASEEIFFDDVSSGAYGDFKSATQIAKVMVTKYGMSDLGTVQYNEGNFKKSFSDLKASEIDQEIHKIISFCYSEAKRIITENKDLIHNISKYLIEMETLDNKDIEEIVKTGKISYWEEIKKNKQKKKKNKKLETEIKNFDRDSKIEQESFSENIEKK